MSHPIDDLFRKGLENVPFEGHEKDWEEARVLLGFEKRKRRFILLLWLFLGLSLSVFGVYFFTSDTSSTTELNYAKSTKNQALPGSDEDAIIETTDKLRNTENELTQSATITLTQSQTEQNQIVQSEADPGQKEQNQLIGISDTSADADDIKATQSDVVSQVSTIQNSIPEQVALSQSKNESTSFGEEVARGSERGGAINEELSDINSDISQMNEASLLATTTSNTESSKTSPSQAIIVDTKEAFEMVTIPAIGHISIQPLLLDTEINALLPDKVDISSSPGTNRLSLGLYTGFVPDRGQWEGGLGLHWSLNARWGVDLGLGVSRFSRKEDDTYQNLMSFDRFASSSNATVSSNNSYRYYSMRIPVRIHYRINKHSVFSGLIFDRPFLLEGRQEVSLNPEMLDTATPADPTPDFAIDPVTSIQEYNLQSAPQLEKWFVLGQIGYSHEIIPRLSVSVAANYRWTREESVSPLIDVSQVSRPETRYSRWNTLLRLDYRFK